MRARLISLVTTLSLLPGAMVLAAARSLLAAVYVASFIVTLLYHASIEQKFKRLDHVLAYGIIFSNTWMTFHTKVVPCALAGLGCVILALVAYRYARLNPSRYDAAHGLWHVLSGAAGYAFASGYAG